MSQDLKSYVEKYLLNPHSNFSEDTEDSLGAKVESVVENDDSKQFSESFSKLRARNTALLSDVDPCYKGVKITRKSLKREVAQDKSLSKYIVLEVSDEELLEEDKFKSCLENNKTESNSGDIRQIHKREIYPEIMNQRRTNVSQGNHEKVKPLIGLAESETSDQVEISCAVKNQLALYDALFEIRIGLQKVLTYSNQLPQYDTFPIFLKTNDINYCQNASSTKKYAKYLLSKLLDLEETMLEKNSATEHMSSSKRKIGSEGNSNSSNNDSADANCDKNGIQRKKLKLSKYKEILAQRHVDMKPFTDKTLLSWDEKAKLLTGKSSKSDFRGFETSVLIQIKNILSNKDQLIQRSQSFRSSGGSNCKVLGKTGAADGSNEEYDSEIFDDHDFYAKCLEDVLKTKLSLSTNAVDTCQKWQEIQNLRKKVKKQVDAKATKGRKLRFEVMSKLQQYLAPCKGPLMDDVAANKLFASLFGKTIG